MKLQVLGGQLERGSLSSDRGGPEVSQVLRPQPQVRRGEAGVKLRGRLGAGGVALHVQAEGDRNHWVIPAAGFDFVVPDELQWQADLAFSYAIDADELKVSLQAVDDGGRAGPVTGTSFAVAPDVPVAKLLVSLGWDAPVDLDLNVVLPDGTMVGAKNVSSGEPTSDGAASSTKEVGGFLDRDSNQQCRLDLRNQEDFVWLDSDPPAGHYLVYADLFSPCDAKFVSFVVTAEHDGEQVARASSTLLDFDSRLQPSHGAAPGLLTAEFDIP